ncbi:MAG: ABC transporter permease [Bacillota bacterium]|jgi:putative ABC transport system permease protein|nr:ABC transporter permease [Bacillota bacterium]NLP21765.1 FtsX-like permease family protein [Erysipelotrichaceae bacterium]
MLIENIKIALNSIKANKLRSILTMLGIIIGIGSVIAIVTIGDSIANGVNKEMQGYGARNIEIYVTNKNEFSTDENMYEVSSVEMSEKDMLSKDMLLDYENAFSNQIQALSIEESIGQITLKNNRFKSNINILGVNKGYKDFNKLEMLSGDFIKENDINNISYNAVVSDKFIKEYFGSKYNNNEVLNKNIEIEINNKFLNLTIAGVYKFKSDEYTDKNTYSNILLPYTTAFKFNKKQVYFQSFKVVPKEDIDVIKFQLDTNTFLSSYYTHNNSYQITTFGLTSLVNSQNDLMNKLKLGISAIAGISLFVGGIGIMNIMMVSVTERTREIGIRMALGAKASTIKSQFIIEAIFISGIGGIIGLILGIIIGTIGSNMMKYSSSPSLFAGFIAISFSMAIGIFFGYYPANKASNLDPIEALRYE